MEMKLTHTIIHTAKPERMKGFHAEYLSTVADKPHPAGRDGQKADTGLAGSAFGGAVYNLSFEGGVRIKLIPERPVIYDALSSISFASALISSVLSSISPAMRAHPSCTVRLTFTVGSRKRVNELTNQLIMGGYDVVCEPGFYRVEHYGSSVFDPEGDIVELVAQKTTAGSRIEPSGTC